MTDQLSNDGQARRSWLGGLALAAPLVGVGAALGTTPWRPAADGDPEQGLSVRERFQRRHLPNVRLTTHEGRNVRFYDDLVKDRKVGITFMYTNCEGICVPAIRNMVAAQRRLGDRVGRDIFFYAITLKPEEDTPELLRQYAKTHGAEPGWQFLTGDPNDIERLRVGLGFTHSDPEWDADPSTHQGMLRLGVEPALRWGHTNTTSPPKHIYRGIRFELDSPTVRDVPTYVAG